MASRRKSSSSPRVESWSADSRSEAAHRHSSAPRRTSRDIGTSSRATSARSKRGPRESITDALLERIPDRTGPAGQMRPTGDEPHAPDVRLPPSFKESPVRTPPPRGRRRR